MQWRHTVAGMLKGGKRRRPTRAGRLKKGKWWLKQCRQMGAMRLPGNPLCAHLVLVLQAGNGADMRLEN
eukprot:scaffold58356_cov21-Tisochrysis_lutea.AAC.3